MVDINIQFFDNNVYFLTKLFSHTYLIIVALAGMYRISGRKNLVVLSAVCLLASACCKKRVYCTSGSIEVAFTGFQRAETRTIVLKRYKVNDHSKALDSAQFIYNGSKPIPVKGNDTLWLSDYTTVGLLKNITADNDWEIYNPYTGRHYLINSISQEGHTFQLEKCSGKETQCFNKITGFGINGGWNASDKLYIQK